MLKIIFFFNLNFYFSTPWSLLPMVTATLPLPPSYIPGGGFIVQLFYFLLALQPNFAGCGLLIHEVFLDHTQPTQHVWYDSSGRVISPSQRPLPDNTQHSQQTNIHAPSRIWTHDLSRWVAADLRLRTSGHWDQLIVPLSGIKYVPKD